jgi:rhodanese-related sulfurtransferase
MNYNSIAFFQFDNLLRNRVPILLLLLEDGLELHTWYDSLVRLHLEAISHRIDNSDALALVREKKLPVQFGILVLDRNGQKSPGVVQELEQAGYMNAFFVPGGYEQLLTEKAQNLD